MNIKNRIICLQADYLFVIMRRPSGWRPRYPDELPPGEEVVSIDHVASLEEGLDDRDRCNRLALKLDLDKWAVLQSGGGDL